MFHALLLLCQTVHHSHHAGAQWEAQLDTAIAGLNNGQEVLCHPLGGIPTVCGYPAPHGVLRTVLPCVVGDSPALIHDGKLEISVKDLAFFMVHVQFHNCVWVATSFAPKITIVGVLVQKVPEWPNWDFI